MHYKKLLLLYVCAFFLAITAQAQVKDSSLKPTDTLKAKPAKPLSRQDSLKANYVNPGKVAGRKAMYRSMIIPGWGQLYNNQILVDDLNAKGEKTGHFWQKTYTLGKVAIIYTGFTLLTLSYIDNSKNYNIFLEEAQYRELNPGERNNLVQYSDAGVLAGKDTYRRNKQVIIFSYIAVYAANVIDAYVAARLHYFNIDDKLSARVSPGLISNPSNMYGFNASPALKLSLKF